VTLAPRRRRRCRFRRRAAPPVTVPTTPGRPTGATAARKARRARSRPATARPHRRVEHLRGFASDHHRHLWRRCLELRRAPSTVSPSPNTAADLPPRDSTSALPVQRGLSGDFPCTPDSGKLPSPDAARTAAPAAARRRPRFYSLESLAASITGSEVRRFNVQKLSGRNLLNVLNRPNPGRLGSALENLIGVPSNPNRSRS